MESGFWLKQDFYANTKNMILYLKGVCVIFMLVTTVHGLHGSFKMVNTLTVSSPQT